MHTWIYGGRVGSKTIKKATYDDYGRTRLRFMSAKDNRLPDNANAQGIVIKVEQRNQAMDRIEGSAIFTGGQRRANLALRRFRRLPKIQSIIRYFDGSASWFHFVF